MAQSNPPKVSDTADWYDDQFPLWKMSDDLMAGTSAMRKAATKYLPIFTLETTDEYNRRIQVAALDNFYEEHYNISLGLMFAETVTIEGSAIPKDQLENIDNHGNSVEAFTEMVAAQIMLKGIHHILVDMPPNPGAQSLADDLALGLRPYWVSVQAEELKNAYYSTEKNVRYLTQARIWGSRMVVETKLSAKIQETIRLYDRTETPEQPRALTFETWVKSPGDHDFELSADPKDKGLIGIDEIPIATGQMDEKYFMRSKSILQDIAFKNIEHWQSASDQRNILTISRYPIQYQIGTEKVVNNLGPGAILHSEGRQTEGRQDVEYGYIEPTGTGIDAGAKDLTVIKEQAQSLSIRNAQGSKTATGDVIDVTISSSPLQRLSYATEQAVNRALGLHAKWLKLPEGAGGKIKISKDFGFSASESARISALMAARANGDIDRETFLAEMKQIGVFKTNPDPAKIAARLAKEQADMFPDVPPEDNNGPGV